MHLRILSADVYIGILIEELTNYISICLSKIAKEKKSCYLLGDFNIDLLKYETNSKNRDFLNGLTS